MLSTSESKAMFRALDKTQTGAQVLSSRGRVLNSDKRFSCHKSPGMVQSVPQRRALSLQQTICLIRQLFEPFFHHLPPANWKIIFQVSHTESRLGPALRYYRVFTLQGAKSNKSQINLRHWCQSQYHNWLLSNCR